MKKRKVDTKSKRSNNVYEDKNIKISKEDTEYFFEIGNDVTNDLAEAVSILIRKSEWNSPVWNLELSEIVSEEIIEVVGFTETPNSPKELLTLYGLNAFNVIIPS